MAVKSVDGKFWFGVIAAPKIFDLFCAATVADAFPIAKFSESLLLVWFGSPG